MPACNDCSEEQEEQAGRRFETFQGRAEPCATYPTHGPIGHLTRVMQDTIRTPGATDQPATTTNLNSTASANLTTASPIVIGNTTEDGNSTDSANLTTASPIVTGNTTEDVNSTANANLTTASPIVIGNTTDNVNSTDSANLTTASPIVIGNTTDNVNSTDSANVTTASPIVTRNTTEDVNSTASANLTTASPIVTGNTTEDVNSTASANVTTASPIVTGNFTENVNSTASANLTTASPIVTGNTTEDVNSTANTIGPESTTMMTTSKPITCSSGACGTGSTCLQLYQTYECQCPLNYRYNATDRTCLRGEGFYGDFLINGVNFDSNTGSKEYTEVYKRVIDMSEASLSGLDGYLGTVIVKISAVSSKSKTRSKRSTVDVSAKVSQIFSQGTKTTAEDVISAIERKYPGAYNNQSICALFCDTTTTTCEPTPDGQGATCTCAEGYYSSSTEHTVTTCRDCSPQCYEGEGKYCNQGSGPMPSCDCRPGFKKNGDTCQACDFGYSGADCKDNYLLILVIVGAVLGAAVVASLGAVIGVSVSSKKAKKYEDRTALIRKNETAFGSDSPAPVRIFPKIQAKTDLGEVNTAVNVYDDNEEYSRNFPKRDYDENPWYEMARKERNY